MNISLGELASETAVPAIIALAATFILYIVRGIAFRIAGRWAAATTTRLDDMLVSSLRAVHLLVRLSQHSLFLSRGVPAVIVLVPCLSRSG